MLLNGCFWKKWKSEQQAGNKQATSRVQDYVIFDRMGSGLCKKEWLSSVQEYAIVDSDLCNFVWIDDVAWVQEYVKMMQDCLRLIKKYSIKKQYNSRRNHLVTYMRKPTE